MKKLTLLSLLLACLSLQVSAKNETVTTAKVIKEIEEPAQVSEVSLCKKNGEYLPKWVCSPFHKDAITEVGIASNDSNKEIKAISDGLISFTYNTAKRAKKALKKHKSFEDKIIESVSKQIVSQKFGNTKINSMLKTYKNTSIIEYEKVTKIIFKDTDKEYKIQIYKTFTSKKSNSEIFDVLENWDIPQNFPYENFIKDLNTNNIFIRKTKETKDNYYILLSYHL